MSKKIGVFLLVIVFLSFVSAQLPIPGAGFDPNEAERVGDEELENEFERIQNATERTREFIEEKKWTYLGEKWKEIFLRSKFIAGLDSFFRNINPVFIILFGQSYDLSLSFYVSVVMWVVFLYVFTEMLMAFAPFKNITSFVVGVGITIAVAQIGLIQFVSVLILKFIFYREGVWRWLSPVGVIFVIVLIAVIVKRLNKNKETHVEKEEEMQEDADRETLHTEAESVRKALPSPKDAFKEGMDKLTNANSLEEAKKMYRKLLFMAHPDKGGSTEKFNELQNNWKNIKRKFGG